MRLFAALSCVSVLAGAAGAARADGPDATDLAKLCDARGTAAAAATLGRFTDAIASRHPDKVTRLFADDATFASFHASGVRASYDQIRDAFVYFLVTNPDVTFSSMAPSSGCGIVALEGQGTWRRPAAKTSVEVEIPVRISMMLVETADGWRIQHYADERLQADAQDVAEIAQERPRRAPAVAGFVARSRVVVPKPVPAPPAADTGAYRAGRWSGDALWFD